MGRRDRAAARRGAGRAGRRRSWCPCPSSLSADRAGAAARRPRRLRRATWPGRCRASRRRRPGSAPGSTPGWRPGSASSSCSTPTTCPAAVTSTSTTTADLRELIEQLRGRPVRRPVAGHVEPPFALVLAGQVVRGRIDAVYADRRRRLPGRRLEDQPEAQTADPLQLAIYRVAWSELTGVPLDRVRAGFYYVRTGTSSSPTTFRAAPSSRNSSAGPDRHNGARARLRRHELPPGPLQRCRCTIWSPGVRRSQPQAGARWRRSSRDRPPSRQALVERVGAGRDRRAAARCQAPTAASLPPEARDQA